MSCELSVPFSGVLECGLLAAGPLSSDSGIADNDLGVM